LALAGRLSLLAMLLNTLLLLLVLDNLDRRRDFAGFRGVGLLLCLWVATFSNCTRDTRLISVARDINQLLDVTISIYKTFVDFIALCVTI
jgi:hypothetical protein